ncbi:MAG: TRAP transporter substrate-binding protein [Planctomycetota bacterium]|nr:TRAP transporter substrate-binding protein [Planctomycetota bacterium]
MFKNLSRTALVAAILAGWLSCDFAWAIDTYRIRLGHAQPTVDIFHVASEKFADLCREKSGGRIQVQIFPTGQLGSLRDMIEGLRIGTLQAVWDVPSRLENYTELASIFNIPYLIENREHGERVWASESGKRLFDELASKSEIRIVALGWRGSRQMTSNRPIRTPDDLKGLKIRVPPYDVPLKTWQTLGATPTPMDWNEVYLALQQGTIDAQENPMTTNNSSRLYEVQPYLILTEVVKNFSSFLMGEKYFNSLPDDIRSIIVESAREASEFQGDNVAENDDQFIQNFRDGKATVIVPDLDAFKDRLKNFVSDNYPEMLPFVNEINRYK